MMNIKSYQNQQIEIENHVIAEEVAAHLDKQAEIRSHVWSLDLSDMVWECCRCFAVLHSGKRRFGKCSGKPGVGIDNEGG